jgi:hypothetical protein
VFVSHELVDERLGGEIVPDLDRSHEPLGVGHDLIVEGELLETEAVHVVEHSRTGDGVDTRERREKGPRSRLEARLGVVELRVRKRHVSLARKLQVLRHLGVAAVDLERFDRGHGVRHEPHVEARGSASEENGVPGRIF